MRPAKLGHAVALLAVIVAIPMAARGDAPTAERLSGTEELDAARFEDATGIHVVHVVATAGGGMLDVRYQVVDPDKALVVHDQERPPALLEQSSGAVLSQAWHRHGAHRALQHGVVYDQLLINVGGVLEPGDEVSVVVGDWRLPHVVIG